MIELNNVLFTYGKKSMRFSFTVEKGDLIIIKGPNGSGKSTLLHLIAGFLTPYSGYIKLNNIDVSNFNPGERPVSILFQENNLFAHLNVITNIYLGINNKANVKKSEKIIISKLINSLDLIEIEKKLPTQLSGGEQKKVALIRCLVRNKSILLLDEPFNSLDSKSERKITNFIIKTHTKKKLTTIIVSHDPKIEKIANKIIQIDDI